MLPGMARLLLLCALAVLLPGCRYNFIPVIPAQVQIDLPVRLTQASLQRRGNDLVIDARIDGPIEGAYLSVVWFAGDQELGRDSRYLDAADRNAEFRLTQPGKNDYTALLLYGGTLLRQLDLREVSILKAAP